MNAATIALSYPWAEYTVRVTLAEEEDEEAPGVVLDEVEHPAIASALMLASPAIRRTLVRRGLRIMATSLHRPVVAAMSAK
jgi:hypothetical protein